MDKNAIWTERYRPGTVEDCVLPERIKKVFREYIKTGEIPHLLLSSSNPGSGKCLDYDTEIEIMVSDELYKILFL